MARSRDHVGAAYRMVAAQPVVFSVLAILGIAAWVALPFGFWASGVTVIDIAYLIEGDAVWRRVWANVGNLLFTAVAALFVYAWTRALVLAEWRERLPRRAPLSIAFLLYALAILWAGLLLVSVLPTVAFALIGLAIGPISMRTAEVLNLTLLPVLFVLKVAWWYPVLLWIGRYVLILPALALGERVWAGDARRWSREVRHEVAITLLLAGLPFIALFEVQRFLPALSGYEIVGGFFLPVSLRAIAGVGAMTIGAGAIVSLYRRYAPTAHPTAPANDRSNITRPRPA